MHQAQTVIKSIATDTRLVFYGFLVLALHAAGILILYDLIPEFDSAIHLLFGYVLSEYSSRGANSASLQVRSAEKFQKHGWATANFRKVDFLVRLAGFLLVGGLFWELAELSFSPLLGKKPDSFFAFPSTLSNIDGALDVTVGAIGATLAFLIKRQANRMNKK